MKKRLVILLAAVTVLSMTACTNDKVPGPEGSEQVVDETEAVDDSVSTEIENKELVNLADGKGVAPEIDIEGCDTFTQIVDKKLEDGMGYANERIGDEDVLLVSSGCFDNGDGFMAAIDATVFRYTDDGIEEVGKVTSGGTAYPLSLKGNNLICGSNHWFSELTIEKGEFVLVDQVWAEYADNEEDNAFYRYTVDDKTLAELDSEDTFWEKTEDFLGGDAIEFSVVSK